MDGYVRLGRQERVGGRPFADPANNASDLDEVRYMANRLRSLLNQGHADWGSPLHVFRMREPDGRGLRVVVSDPARLVAGDRDVIFVGFFGQKRLGVDPAPVHAVDEDLIHEIPRFPGILSYKSLELANGESGNVVFMDGSEAIEQWRTSPKHDYAARELSPVYYQSVRLHNGVLRGGLMAGEDPVILCTKYYHFEGFEPWKAVRYFEPA